MLSLTTTLFNISLSCNETFIGRGSDYEGCQNMTRNCKTCQNWRLQSPHAHTYSYVGDHNYCRNPDGAPNIWCYTTDPDVRWDFCLPKPETCAPNTTNTPSSSSNSTCDSDETLIGSGFDYSGCQNMTVNCRECQKWSSQTPHAHSYSYVGDHNHCRNPDGEPTIWCYTTDPEVRWEFCIPKDTSKTCVSHQSSSSSCNVNETLVDRGFDYRGCRNSTVNCRTCQNWSAQTPHAHKYSYVGDHNYCRNPDGEPNIWCYTTDPDVRWELCAPKDPNVFLEACAEDTVITALTSSTIESVIIGIALGVCIDVFIWILYEMYFSFRRYKFGKVTQAEIEKRMIGSHDSLYFKVKYKDYHAESLKYQIVEKYIKNYINVPNEIVCICVKYLGDYKCYYGPYVNWITVKHEVYNEYADIHDIEIKCDPNYHNIQLNRDEQSLWHRLLCGCNGFRLAFVCFVVIFCVVWMGINASNLNKGMVDIFMTATIISSIGLIAVIGCCCRKRIFGKKQFKIEMDLLS